jgi:uncharacterized protein YndB with AHSA1/START domain
MEKITVSIELSVPVLVAWELFTNPIHIPKWCFASADWCAPRAENDLRVGGKFTTRMEAKDGSAGFDFEGVYTDVVHGEHFVYVLEDGREIRVRFTEHHGVTEIREVFDPETENPIEMQRSGWQSILNNFKQYAEKTYQTNHTPGSDTGIAFISTTGGTKDTRSEQGDTQEGGGTDAGGDGGGGGGD